MSLKEIREIYDVPAFRNRYIEVYYNLDGNWILASSGVIWAGGPDLIFIKRGPGFHPTKGVVYFNEDGSILKDTRYPLSKGSNQ